jgi:hypothetical protein
MRLVLYIVTAHIDLSKILGLDFLLLLLFFLLRLAQLKGRARLMHYGKRNKASYSIPSSTII